MFYAAVSPYILFKRARNIKKYIKKHINAALFYRVFSVLWWGFSFFFFSFSLFFQQISLDFLKVHFEIMPLLVYVYILYF